MSKTTTKPDVQIQREVLSELRWDPRVEDTDVGVEVDDGIVTLTGTVRTYGARRAAQEASHRVRGVLDVVNDIEVRPFGSRTDTDIAADVRHALERDVFVPADRIRTTVSHGLVTLEGEVDLYRQRADAEHAIHHIPGVVGVVDELNVRKRAVSAGEIHQAIEEALERQAEREADRIRVEVADGRVTLTGRVRSFREKRAILGTAGHAPGVTSVVDHIKVAPYS
jgi:osmotically-inducible protein OsmY